jgi:hypothetical protein
LWRRKVDVGVDAAVVIMVAELRGLEETEWNKS